MAGAHRWTRAAMRADLERLAREVTARISQLNQRDQRIARLERENADLRAALAVARAAARRQAQQADRAAVADASNSARITVVAAVDRGVVPLWQSPQARPEDVPTQPVRQITDPDATQEMPTPRAATA